MKLLHKITIGRKSVLILKKVLRKDFLGSMVGVNINFPMEVDMYLDSWDQGEKEHIKELEEMHVDCAIPVKVMDEVVAYYVHFIDNNNKPFDAWVNLKAILEHELRELLQCKYLIVERSYRSKDVEIAVDSVEAVQQVLNNMKLPFEFTIDEQLCMLRKSNKIHTKQHVYAKCKYYKTKEGEYVIMQKFPDKAKEKVH